MTTNGAPLWIKAVVTREGNDVVTKCCIVTGADIHPFEVRVNLPALAASLRAMGLGPKGDAVGGFGSFLKKAVKAVTKNKIVKAVGKVVGKVAKSPIVQIANPMAAIAIHTLSRAAGGKGTIKGKAGAAVDIGTAVVAPAALSYVRPAATAALGIGARAVQASTLAKTIGTVARDAQKAIAQGKSAAALLKAGKIDASVSTPLVKKALAVRGAVQKLAPTLAKKVAFSRRAQDSIRAIASKSKSGSLEARLAATSIASAAKMQDKISAAQQAAGGGHPGFVITTDGKIRKAPKGKFVMTRSLPVLETLYRGAKVEPMKGAFTAVSGQHDYGPSWGGTDDPADEYEGPLYPVRYPVADSVSGNRKRPAKRRRVEHEFFDRPTLIPSSYPELEAETYLAMEYDTPTLVPPPIGGRPLPARARSWPRPAPGTTAAARERAAALLELARARHHAEQVLKRARTTKVGNMSYDLIGDSGTSDIPPELAEVNDGLTAELIGCALNQSVSGFPSYLFTRKGLHPTVVRRRFLAALKAMPPKMRRRALTRLKHAMARTRISGAIQSMQPSFGYYPQGGWETVSGHIAIGCNAGALTP